MERVIPVTTRRPVSLRLIWATVSSLLRMRPGVHFRTDLVTFLLLTATRDAVDPMHCRLKSTAALRVASHLMQVTHYWTRSRTDSISATPAWGVLFTISSFRRTISHETRSCLRIALYRT